MQTTPAPVDFAPGPGPGARTRSHWWRLARAVLAGAAAAVAGLAQDTPPAPAAEIEPPGEPAELIKIDTPMRAFFEARISRVDHSDTQLRKLIDGILQPDGMHLVYDAEGTFAARECFRQRRGNCVSIALLVVAVAREFGYEAAFQNVTREDRWERFGDLIVSINHMNVRVETDDGTHIVDLRPDMFSRVNLRGAEVISDRRAFAQFYGNIGFFKLVHNQPEAAEKYLRRSTQIDPECASAWSNLASMYSRQRNLPAARAGYERALRLDPRDVTALDGYVSVLQRQGSPADLRVAVKYERRAQAIRDRNPYYQRCLAAQAQDRGDWVRAEKILRKAIALKDDEPQFYEQWVTALTQLGRIDDARRATTQLEKLRQKLAAPSVQPTH